MSLQKDFNRETGTRLLKLVLALYRNQLVEMPDAGHTDDILLLLRLANGDSELMAWAGSVTGAEADELRKSCVAFVERICFSGDTNPFNVLGLNPWANADAVKEHYRLLIRIFHPDRGQVSNKAAEDYSARINQAYAALKKQILDDGTNLTQPSRTHYHVQNRFIPRRFTRPVNTENNGGNAMRWAAQLTPTKVLFGFALLAGLIIYLSFPNKIRMPSKAVQVVEKPQLDHPDIDLIPGAVPAITEMKAFSDVITKHDAAETTLKEETRSIVAPAMPANEAQPVRAENAPILTRNLIKLDPAKTVNDSKMAAVAAKSDTKPQSVKTVMAQTPETRQVEKRIEAKPVESKSAAIKPIEAKLVQTKPVQANPVQIKPVETKSVDTKPVEEKPAEVKLVEIKPVPIKPVNNTPVLPAAVAAASVSSLQSTVELPMNKKSSATSRENAVAKLNEVPVQAKVVTSRAANIPSDNELHEVINSFMTHYSNGDINRFMQAFDDQVHSDEGSGKPDLYRAYADFFAKTTSRSMVLKDLTWEKHGPLAIAHAAYRVSIQREGEAKITSSSGSLQLEVVKNDGRVVISGFFYQDAKK